MKFFEELVDRVCGWLPGATNMAASSRSRGKDLLAKNHPVEALAHFDRALRLKPRDAAVLNQRANALLSLGRATEALETYDAALGVEPGFADALYNRGIVLQQLGRRQEALASYERAMAIAPGDFQACNNCGILLGELGQLDAALNCLDRAIALNPGYAVAWYNRGIVLAERPALAEACLSYEQAIALDPDYAQAHWNLGLCQLLMGDFERGWRQFEWRWKNTELGIRLKELAQPLWLGESSLQGRTILLQCEQGLGDTLQFCRYVGLLHGLGARVVIEAQAPLVALLAGLDGVAEVVAQGGTLPDFDFRCPLLSLPLAFRTTLQTIPAHPAYLASDAAKAASWAARIARDERIAVGIVWSGGFRPEQPATWAINERRNMHPKHLARLDLPGIRFYSLQKGEFAISQLSELRASGWRGPEVIDFTADLHDFSDTAALVANLDLIISVDTAVAHLAGALGKPVWLLNRHDTCWRWLVGRDDTPWYPSMKIFRQSMAGDWDGVIDAVRRELVAWRSPA